MIENLNEIKRIRKGLWINQKELAERAGVSQSLIAKIEAGKIDPGFTKAKQIFQALNELREKEEIKAGEIMNRKLIFAKPTDKVKDLIHLLKKRGISQMPVLRREKVCGLVSEGSILKKIVEYPEKLNTLTAEDIMDEVPPIVPSNTGMKTLLELLKDSPAVLVAEKGDIKGIICKTDLLEMI